MSVNNSYISDVDIEMCDVQQESPKDDEVKTSARKRAQSILQSIECGITYGIENRPPLYSTVMFAIQHFLADIGSFFSNSLVIASLTCIENDLVAYSKLISTVFVISGIQTFLQSTFGSRLPIVQGPSFAFLVPVISLINLRDECPVVGDPIGNSTITEDDVRLEFEDRMQEISGAILIASIYEVVVGLTGITGLLLTYIGPLTIAPTIALIGMSLFSVASNYGSDQWGITFMTVGLVAIFSQYIERFPVPCPGYTRSKGCEAVKVPIFKLFPVFLAVAISWLFCYILTVTDVFPDDPEKKGYSARTDVKSDQLDETSWFYVPYPGQFGLPTFNPAGILGMIAGCTASIIESMGDYFATAKIAGAPPPPSHAVNRGIGVEGIGGIFAAMWGSGVGATSYSQNIGTIGITKVGSRFVIQFVALIAIILGLWIKAGAFLATLPSPIVGGVLAVSSGLVMGVGIGSLQYANMNSSRNLFIVGMSFFVGIVVPAYVNSHKDDINTGSELFDEILIIILGTSMFIGGSTGFFLDNTIPGTAEERGIVKFRQLQGHVSEDAKDVAGDDEFKKETARLVNKCYEFPFGMSSVRTWRWATYIPFCPTFRGFNIRCPRRRRCCKATGTESITA